IRHQPSMAVLGVDASLGNVMARRKSLLAQMYTARQQAKLARERAEERAGKEYLAEEGKIAGRAKGRAAGGRRSAGLPLRHHQPGPRGQVAERARCADRRRCLRGRAGLHRHRGGCRPAPRASPYRRMHPRRRQRHVQLVPRVRRTRLMNKIRISVIIAASVLAAAMAAALPAATAASGSGPPPVGTVRLAGPMRADPAIHYRTQLAGPRQVSAGTVTSLDWAGYAVTADAGQTIGRIQDLLTIPDVNCAQSTLGS